LGSLWELWEAGWSKIYSYNSSGDGHLGIQYSMQICFGDTSDGCATAGGDHWVHHRTSEMTWGLSCSSRCRSDDEFVAEMDGRGHSGIRRFSVWEMPFWRCPSDIDYLPPASHRELYQTSIDLCCQQRTTVSNHVAST